MTNQINRVKVYYTPECRFSTELRAWLDNAGIKYRAFDVFKDANQCKNLVRVSGQIGVPVTEIDGEVVIGWHKVKIEKLLTEAGLLKL